MQDLVLFLLHINKFFILLQANCAVCKADVNGATALNLRVASTEIYGTQCIGLYGKIRSWKAVSSLLLSFFLSFSFFRILILILFFLILTIFLFYFLMIGGNSSNVREADGPRVFP